MKYISNKANPDVLVNLENVKRIARTNGAQTIEKGARHHIVFDSIHWSFDIEEERDNIYRIICRHFVTNIEEIKSIKADYLY